MKRVLKPEGKLDVLYYYSLVSKKLLGFLKGKEIATKVWLGNFFFIRRGSKSPPLYIQELGNVSKNLLKLRSKMPLKEARDKGIKKQVKTLKERFARFIFEPPCKSFTGTKYSYFVSKRLRLCCAWAEFCWPSFIPETYTRRCGY